MVSVGTYDEVKKNEHYLTAKYISGTLNNPLPSKRNKKDNTSIEIIGERENNLKDLDVKMPLNTM